MSVAFLDNFEGAAPQRQLTPEQPRSKPFLAFRTFVVVPTARRLLCDSGEVELGGRAFDLLVVLIQARGRVVRKDELMRMVWPSTIVDESNLRFQMAVLRKVLGRHRDVIKTVNGRGYLFAEDVPLQHWSSPTGPGARRAEPGNELALARAAAADACAARDPCAAGKTAASPTDRISALEHENTRLRLAMADLAIASLSSTAQSFDTQPQ
jgi:DNA-binding winged helix-turn-helix (wHTH) protein